MPKTGEKALGSSTEYGLAGLDGARSSSVVNKAAHPPSEVATNSTKADRMVVGVASEEIKLPEKLPTQ